MALPNVILTILESDFDQPAIPAISEIPAIPAIPEIPAIPAIFGRCQKWTWSEPARGKSTSSRSIADLGDFKQIVSVYLYSVFDLLICFVLSSYMLGESSLRYNLCAAPHK